MSPPTEATATGADNVVDIGVVGPGAPTGDRRQHPGPGYWLRQARERRGWTQREAADMLNLSVRFLAALEDETFDKLPAAAYARGYLRAYAKVLNLSGDEIMRRYESVVGDDSDPYFNDLRSARRAPVLDFVRAHPGLIVSVLGSLAGVLLLTVLWWGWGLVRQQGPTLEPAFDALNGAAVGVGELAETAVPSAAPSAAAVGNVALPAAAPGSDLIPVESEGEAAAVPPASDAVMATPPTETSATVAASGTASLAGTGADRVDLTAGETSWVDIRDATGSKIYSNNVAGGSAIAVRGTAPFTVVLGNAPGAQLLVNGKPFDVEANTRGRVATLVAGP